MEDIITIAIILIGVGIKIYGAFKKNKPEVEESDDGCEMLMKWCSV